VVPVGVAGVLATLALPGSTRLEQSILRRVHDAPH
jgi:hypothetical protein